MHTLHTGKSFGFRTYAPSLSFSLSLFLSIYLLMYETIEKAIKKIWLQNPSTSTGSNMEVISHTHTRTIIQQLTTAKIKDHPNKNIET